MVWQRIVRLVTVGFLVMAMYGLPTIALADKKVCTRDEAQSAEMVAAVAKSWRQLYQRFERYAHCDDGAIAEGFSESVSLLFVDQWRDIRQLDIIIRIDPSFLEFVIKHIDETVPVDRLEHIRRNAGKLCPQDMENLCREVESRAVQVLLTNVGN